MNEPAAFARHTVTSGSSRAGSSSKMVIVSYPKGRRTLRGGVRRNAKPGTETWVAISAADVEP